MFAPLVKGQVVSRNAFALIGSAWYYNCNSNNAHPFRICYPTYAVRSIYT